MAPGFSLDIEHCAALFDRMDVLAWQSPWASPTAKGRMFRSRGLPGARSLHAGARLRSRGRGAGDEARYDPATVLTSPARPRQRFCRPAGGLGGQGRPGGSQPVAERFLWRSGRRGRVAWVRGETKEAGKVRTFAFRVWCPAFPASVLSISKHTQDFDGAGRRSGPNNNPVITGFLLQLPRIPAIS